MILALSILLATFAVLTAVTTFTLVRRLMIGDSDAFLVHVRKLTMANSIDKAIKLCNSVPRTLLADMLKRLLISANKPEQERAAALAESFQRAARVKAPASKWRGAPLALLIAGALSISCMVLVIAPHQDSLTDVSIAVSIFVLLKLWTARLVHALYVHTVVCEAAATELYHAINRRAEEREAKRA